MDLQDTEVPQSPAQVTSDWLAQSLGADPRFRGARWAEIETTRVGEGFGLAGVLLRIQVPGSLTPSLIVKLATWTPDYDEPDFYRRIAPEMPVRLPECYGLGQDVTGRCVVLLEDLSQAAQGDCLIGATDAQTEALVSAIARYHARFWGGTDPLISDLDRFEFEAQTSFDDFEGHCQRLLERFAAEAGPNIEALLSELPARAASSAALFGDVVPTFTHTDLHLDNVLFVGDEPVILDWPGATLGPGAIDLARVLIEGMTLEQRRRRQPRLVALYREVLTSSGVTAPSTVQLDDHLAAACAWMCSWALGWAGSKDPGMDRPRVPALISSLVRNSFGAAHDNWLRAHSLD